MGGLGALGNIIFAPAGRMKKKKKKKEKGML